MFRSTRSRITAAATTAVVGGIAAGSLLTGAAQAGTLSVASHPTVVLRPDLAVSQPYFADGPKVLVRVSNVGVGASGQFRIALLAGAQSKSIEVSNLTPGSSKVVDVTDLSCNQAALVWADVDQTTSDSNRSNNVMTFHAPCPIDDGTNGVPVHEP